MSMPKGLIILGDLMDQDLIWLARAGEVRTIAQGEVLIREGHDLDDLFVVTDGTFEVTAGGQRIANIQTGDILGEMSFVEKRPPSTTVTALGPARVLAVPRGALMEEFGRNEGFAARFYRALAVFLSDRLRAMTPGGDENEIDELLLDTLHVAGDRMLRLIGLLEGELEPG